MKRIYLSIPKALLLSVVFLLSAAAPSFGGAALTVSYNKTGTVSLQGSAMDGIAALDVVLRYDAKRFSKPRVTAGSLIKGALTATNTRTPGIVRIAIVRVTPLKGSGDILSLTFTTTGSAAAAVTGLRLKATDANGKPMAVTVHIGK